MTTVSFPPNGDMIYIPELPLVIKDFCDWWGKKDEDVQFGIGLVLFYFQCQERCGVSGRGVASKFA